MESVVNDPVVFDPSNEPYVGLETLRALDDTIVACLRLNAEIAPRTHLLAKTKLQLAACQLVPAGISLALSVRELIRQGYLYGALVLIRPLAERVITILFLRQFPDKLDVWHDGWHHRKRPTLARMLDEIAGQKFPNCGADVTRALNSLTHGDPESSKWNVVTISDEIADHAVSKMLDRPDICNTVALDAAIWLAVLTGVMPTLFPNVSE